MKKQTDEFIVTFSLSEWKRIKDTIQTQRYTNHKLHMQLKKKIEFLNDYCGIYQITNLTNNKIYIGKSISIKNRWNTHIQRLCDNKHDNHGLQKDFDEFGIKAFEFSLIEDCAEEEVELREYYHIFKKLKKYELYNVLKSRDFMIKNIVWYLISKQIKFLFNYKTNNTNLKLDFAIINKESNEIESAIFIQKRYHPEQYEGYDKVCQEQNEKLDQKVKYCLDNNLKYIIIEYGG